MFGKKKEEEKWEFEELFAMATERLLTLERLAKEEEGDILADRAFAQGQLATAQTASDKAMLEKRIAAADDAIKAIPEKYGLPEARANAKDYEMRKELWLERRRQKPLSKDSRFAGAVTIGVALSGAIVERLGRIAPLLKSKLPLPKIWK